MGPIRRISRRIRSRLCSVSPLAAIPTTLDDAAEANGVQGGWWRQGMMGSAKAHYEGIKAFSETDPTEDLKAIRVPTLMLHGKDDLIVPIHDSALKSVEPLQKRTLMAFAKA